MRDKDGGCGFSSTSKLGLRDAAKEFCRLCPCVRDQSAPDAMAIAPGLLLLLGLIGDVLPPLAAATGDNVAATGDGTERIGSTDRVSECMLCFAKRDGVGAWYVNDGGGASEYDGCE